ncbi:MAG: ATP-dependent helicase [Oligoflexia bacterium]|nr:ATP-dependent helicase [Oligoflexia bacterium]
MSKWVSHLNAEQKQAALHNKGPQLILAGAGSGKTTVLVSRTGRLIDEGIASPRQIAVLTFTNKAAAEIKHRVAAKLGPIGEGVWAGTFHSFGLLILKQFHKECGLPKSFGIIDSQDAQAVAKDLLKDVAIPDKDSFDIGRLLSILSRWRETRRTEAVNPEDPYQIAAQWLLPRYEKRLRTLGVVDFDGLLLKPLELIKTHSEIRQRVQNAFTQIMVDEFQDTSVSQLDLVLQVAEPHGNLTVVGDDDQSIYGWRGACVENILSFPKLFSNCKVVRLERNYRSTPSIIAVANAIIAKNEKRHAKVLKAGTEWEENLKPELFTYENEDDEIQSTLNDIVSRKGTGAWNRFAILFRSNGQGALFEAELRKRQIPYQIAGGMGFFDRREVKDVLSFIRCAIRPNEMALRRVLNIPNRGIGDTSLERMAEFSLTQHVGFWSTCKRWREAGVPDSAGQSLDLFFSKLECLKSVLVQGSRSAGAELTSWLIDLGYREHLSKQSHREDVIQMRWGLAETVAIILDKFVARGGRSEKTVREFLDALELHDAAGQEQEKSDGIQLLTLHASKGLEFETVYLVGVEEDLIPHKTLGTDSTEERRLFYVGITRAKQNLILSHVRTRTRFGKTGQVAPSRFLIEIPKELLQHFPQGARPLKTEERKNLINALFQKIDSMNTPSESI